jgi:hypothetical protein
MDVLITTPFHPAYMTAERLNKAKNLKLIVTAGVGSDHVDLNTAAAKGLTVSEVSGMIMNLTLLNTKNLILPCWVAGKHRVKPQGEGITKLRACEARAKHKPNFSLILSPTGFMQP